MAKNTTLLPDAGTKTVLLTGGSGSIGRPLTRLLLKKGYTVHHLVRKGSEPAKEVKSFVWDLDERTIDPDCIKGVTAIIHLAGEPVAAKPWTNKRMSLITSSRTESIRMIYQLLANGNHQVSTVISASAIGYYGNRNEEWLTEEMEPGTDFLSRCCVAWEKAVDEAPSGIRTVKLRTGIVLHEQDGALAPIAKTIRLGVGAPLGSGKQWMSWIHLDDAVKLYLFMLEHSALQGVFNMTAPEPVRNKEFTRVLAGILQKKLWLPHVPAFALRVVMGKMSVVILESVRASSGKVESAGFKFSYPRLADALKKIYE